MLLLIVTQETIRIQEGVLMHNHVERPTRDGKETLKRKDQEQDIRIDKVIRNRKRNTYAVLITFLLTILVGTYTYQVQQQIKREQAIQSEIAQLVVDEGYRRCAYLDSLGKATIGFGHLLTANDKLYKQSAKGKLCISAKDAVEQLRKDYTYASRSVQDLYPWANEDVQLVLTNMTYQMGVEGVRKFKMTLAFLKSKQYDLAASEMLDSTWARQTSTRSVRLAGRIMSLE